MSGVTVRLLAAADVEARLDQLAALLVDAVESGASVGFMLPFAATEARAFWLAQLPAVRAGTTILLVAHDHADRVTGTVLLKADTPPNQPHRADIAKLLVHRSSRNRGVGRALMEAVEAAALARGRTLLVLDTANAAACRLYERLGWTRAGVIPGYALLPSGELGDTLIYWKWLTAPRLPAPVR